MSNSTNINANDPMIVITMAVITVGLMVLGFTMAV